MNAFAQPQYIHTHVGRDDLRECAYHLDMLIERRTILPKKLESEVRGMADKLRKEAQREEK